MRTIAEVLTYPKTMEHKALDPEKLLPAPRRATGTAQFADLDSFARYVLDFAKPGNTMVWCNFNPATYALDFTGVINDHGPILPGWRDLKATYQPAMSAEWGVWAGSNKKQFSQVEFAEFIEANEQDIHTQEGMPTSLDMHKLATEFIARQDTAIKSVVRLQSGGVRLDYVADADAGTVEAMKLFERFAIAIPVFWTAPTGGETESAIKAYKVEARLKYRFGAGKVTFFYELIRPDRVHQKAAVELIEAMRLRMATAGVQLLMGGMRG
ncbi:MAG: hypothetical protein RLZZ182_196 [Pseudomonadota bacterium]|jgi:uncharacterized protein YfdQ (DUF2303 family)